MADQASGGTKDAWAEWYAEACRSAAEERARVASLQREADQQWADWYRTTHPELDHVWARSAGHRRLVGGLRGVAGFFVLVACLVVPWLLPWPGPTIDPVASNPLGAGPNSEARSEADSVSSPPDANAIRRLRAATNTQAAGYDAPVSAKALAAVRTTPGPYRKLGRLEIPSLSLSVSYGEGVFAETLDKSPGHWPGTPAPGSSGNAVISGHRNTHTRPFKELDELDPGDKIITSYGDRSPVTFEVVKTTIVPEAEYREFVLRQPTDTTTRALTLFACHPEGNPVFRIVVEARAQR